MTRNGTRLGVAVVVGLAMIFAGALAAVAGPPGTWPSKKGEVCFLVDAGGEWSVLELQVTNTGGSHYSLQGWARQWDGYPGSPIQPINGSAEVHPSGDVVALITKVEYRPGATEPQDEFETYNGMMLMGGDFSNAGAVGTIYSCTNTATPTCQTIFSYVDLYYDADCDPESDPPTGFPPGS